VGLAPTEERRLARRTDISGFDIRSMLLAVGGSVLVLFIYGLLARGRA
jgi:hypothetical protein